MTAGMLDYCLSEQRRLQVTYLALGKERERRRRRRERELRLKEESKKCENIRIALQAKLTAIERALEKRRNSTPGGGSNGFTNGSLSLNGKENFDQLRDTYDVTRRKLQERMTTIERKLKGTKRRKCLENGNRQSKQCERRKLKRQRVKNKTTRILHEADQDYGTPMTSKLDGAAKLQPALEILDDLMNSHLAAPFCEPVDPVKYHIPDYFKKIRKPMDLGTVRMNVSRGQYEELEEVWADIRLVWENCRTYNGPSNPFTIKANALAQMFEARLERFSEISPRKSGRVRKPPKRMDDMLTPPRINSPLDKNTLRKKMHTLNPTQLERVARTLGVRGKAFKNKEGNHEIDFDTMGEDTAFELDELLRKEVEHCDENVREKQAIVKKPEVKRRLPAASRRGRQTLTPSRIRWSSKLGHVPGRMELFEMDNKDVFSSSSSSDEGINIFKLQEKDVSATTSKVEAQPKSLSHPSNLTVEQNKTAIETPSEKKVSITEPSSEKSTDYINHSKDARLEDDLFS